jgi:mannan endo-1,4-beta-mannosidase
MMHKKSFFPLLILTAFVALIVFSQAGKVSASSGFRVDNGTLMDSNGNSFVIRGINNPHIWYDTKAFNALDEIAKTGANTVRIVWDTTGKASRLEEIIKRCIELNMIAMPELHCATGTDDIEKIKDRARYWAREDVREVLIKYNEYVIVNIANECGYSRHNTKINDEVWRDVYKECIDIMRNVGITNTIVIDSRSFGQDYLCVAKYGQDLIDYDPLHNLMFGIHMYVEWNDKNKIIEKLELLKSQNLPIIIGEFGYNHNQGKNNLNCEVNAQTILDECEKHGFGYIAWSWAGNNQENAWLDMAYDWVNYTEWGDFLVNGKNGIKQTSTVCSVFEDTPDLKAEANYSGAVLYSSTIPGIIEQFSCTDQNPENCKRFDLSGINPLLSSIQFPLCLFYNPCCLKSLITSYQADLE